MPQARLNRSTFEPQLRDTREVNKLHLFSDTRTSNLIAIVFESRILVYIIPSNNEKYLFPGHYAAEYA